MTRRRPTTSTLSPAAQILVSRDRSDPLEKTIGRIREPAPRRFGRRGAGRVYGDEIADVRRAVSTHIEAPRDAVGGIVNEKRLDSRDGRDPGEQGGSGQQSGKSDPA